MLCGQFEFLSDSRRAQSEFRKLCLQQALSNAIEAVDLRVINREPDALALAADFRKLASRGIRGEFIFALPIGQPVRLAWSDLNGRN